MNEIKDNIHSLKCFLLCILDIKTDLGKINYYFPKNKYLLNIIQKIKIVDKDN